MATGRSWLAAAALLVVVPAAQAAESALDWLLRMREAARTANYQGVVVYHGDDVLETFRVTHRYDASGERERVQSLTGEVREILKRDDKVICLLPKNQKLTMVQPTPQGLLPVLSQQRLQQIAQLYDLKDLGAARVAGRSCRGIAIAPRDAYRYGYEVWADAETAVPLKVSLVGPEQRRIEQMFFTEVEFPQAIPDSAFEMQLDSERMRQVTQTAAGAITAAADEVAATQNQQTDPAASTDLEFGRLPPGFHVTTRDVRVLPDKRGTVEHVMLSDGLTSISIFRARQRRPPTAGAGNGAAVSQMGGMQAYGRMVGRMHVTVVGEAPAETLRMIADNLKPEPEAPQPLAAAPNPAPGEAAAAGPRP